MVNSVKAIVDGKNSLSRLLIQFGELSVWAAQVRQRS